MNIPWYVQWYVHYTTPTVKENVRKIVKNGRNSYYINIPKEVMRELKWKERQKLVVRRRGAKIVVEDWKQ